MGVIPAEYYARCTETDCTWQVSTTALSNNPDPRKYRDELASRHVRNYGHHVTTTDYGTADAETP